ncbi:hypothetical protein L0F63_002306, partial [Massospora cicadina]
LGWLSMKVKYIILAASVACLEENPNLSDVDLCKLICNKANKACDKKVIETCHKECEWPYVKELECNKGKLSPCELLRATSPDAKCLSSEYESNRPFNETDLWIKLKVSDKEEECDEVDCTDPLHKDHKECLNKTQVIDCTDPLHKDHEECLNKTQVIDCNKPENKDHKDCSSPGINCSLEANKGQQVCVTLATKACAGSDEPDRLTKLTNEAKEVADNLAKKVMDLERELATAKKDKELADKDLDEKRKASSEAVEKKNKCILELKKEDDEFVNAAKETCEKQKEDAQAAMVAAQKALEEEKKKLVPLTDEYNYALDSVNRLEIKASTACKTKKPAIEKKLADAKLHLAPIETSVIDQKNAIETARLKLKQATQDAKVFSEVVCDALARAKLEALKSPPAPLTNQINGGNSTQPNAPQQNGGVDKNSELYPEEFFDLAEIDQQPKTKSGDAFALATSTLLALTLTYFTI